MLRIKNCTLQINKMGSAWCLWCRIMRKKWNNYSLLVQWSQSQTFYRYVQPTWSNLHNFKLFCCVQQISSNVHSLKRFHYVQQTSSNVYGLKRFSYVQQTSLNIHSLERFRYVQQTSSQGVYPSVSKWASVEGPWVSHFTENLFIVSQNSTFE